MKSAASLHLHALHGFLGGPGDWDIFPFKMQIFAHNLFQDFPIASFSDWAKEFNLKASAQEGKRIFMGYSLGGRLGLHAILQTPSLWSGAIFISTHPGLKSNVERKERLDADYLWAERFEGEPWSSLMHAWNSQKVFHGDSAFRERLEKDFDRHSLAHSLRTWSLGNQQDLSLEIQKLKIPCLWMAGENDLKFSRRTQELSFPACIKSKIAILPETGHRIPWQQPQAFMSHINEFINNLEQ